MIGSSENRVSYNGNGVAREFAYEFKILNESDLKVLLVNADGTEKLLTKDYYVDMEKRVVHYPGYAPGAGVPEEQRPPVLPIGSRLVLYRDVPITQQTKLDQFWPFNVIESALDKLTIICQQLLDKADRSFHVSTAQKKGFNTQVPIEPGKTLRINNAGDGLELTDDPARVLPLVNNALKKAEAARDVAIAKADAAGASAVSAAESEVAADRSATQAEAAKTAANASETVAAQSAAAANASEEQAGLSAVAAGCKADEARKNADLAKGYADKAKASEDKVATSANEAKTAAGQAKTSATNAQKAASQADTSAVQAGHAMKNAKAYEEGSYICSQNALESERQAGLSAVAAENKAKEAAKGADLAKGYTGKAEEAKKACEATKAGWDNIMDSINGFNALGLYADSEGYICQKE